MTLLKAAKAEVAQLRQQTQYTCCATSIAAALRAHGKNVSEDEVNRVLGASPMAGASWEAMLATVQYFGCRGTLVVPSTPRMLKAWTDAGIPVVIAWNPENRPWSHASTVYDVVEGDDGKLTVYIMDPNIPNPSQTTRVVGEDEFCQKWGEKVSDSLIVRRPAMAVELEVSAQGRQMVASSYPIKVRNPGQLDAAARRVMQEFEDGDLSYKDLHEYLTRRGFEPQPLHDYAKLEADPEYQAWLKRNTHRAGANMSDDTHVAKAKETVKIKKEDMPKPRHGTEWVQDVVRRPGAGKHHTREDDVSKGRSRKPKHKDEWSNREANDALIAAWGKV